MWQELFALLLIHYLGGHCLLVHNSFLITGGQSELSLCAPRRDFWVSPKGFKDRDEMSSVSLVRGPPRCEERRSCSCIPTALSSNHRGITANVCTSALCILVSCSAELIMISLDKHLRPGILLAVSLTHCSRSTHGGGIRLPLTHAGHCALQEVALCRAPCCPLAEPQPRATPARWEVLSQVSFQKWCDRWLLCCKEHQGKILWGEFWSILWWPYDPAYIWWQVRTEPWLAGLGAWNKRFSCQKEMWLGGGTVG